MVANECVPHRSTLYMQKNVPIIDAAGRAFLRSREDLRRVAQGLIEYFCARRNACVKVPIMRACLQATVVLYSRLQIQIWPKQISCLALFPLTLSACHKQKRFCFYLPLMK